MNERPPVLVKPTAAFASCTKRFYAPASNATVRELCILYNAYHHLEYKDKYFELGVYTYTFRVFHLCGKFALSGSTFVVLSKTQCMFIVQNWHHCQNFCKSFTVTQNKKPQWHTLKQQIKSCIVIFDKGCLS